MDALAYLGSLGTIIKLLSLLLLLFSQCNFSTKIISLFKNNLA